MRRKITWISFLLIIVWLLNCNSQKINNKATKIAIVGGESSGLNTAYELFKLGYRDITIFEKDEEAGGKVLTYFHRKTGNPYEVGAIVQSHSFRYIERIAEETGYARGPSEWEKPYPGRGKVVDFRGSEISSFLSYHTKLPGSSDQRYTYADDLLAAPTFTNLLNPIGKYSVMGLYDSGFDALFKSAFFNVGEVSQSFDDFMSHIPALIPFRTVDASSLRGRFSLFFNICGYGFTSEVPALYHMKFFPMVFQAAFEQIMTGTHKSGLTNARYGYQSLFVHVKNWLVTRRVKMRLSHKVYDVVRPNATSWGNLAGESNHLLFQ